MLRSRCTPPGGCIESADPRRNTRRGRRLHSRYTCSRNMVAPQRASSHYLLTTSIEEGKTRPCCPKGGSQSSAAPAVICWYSVGIMGAYRNNPEVASLPISVLPKNGRGTRLRGNHQDSTDRLPVVRAFRPTYITSLIHEGSGWQSRCGEGLGFTAQEPSFPLLHGLCAS